MGAYARALKAAQHLAIDANAPLDDVGHLRRMHDSATQAVERHPTDLAPEPPAAHAVSFSTTAEASPEPNDPVLEALLVAAHAAVDRSNTATIAAMLTAIAQHRAGLAGAREGAPEGATEAGAPGLRRGGA